MADKQAQEKLAQARVTMLLDYPFFASLALNLPLTESHGLGTTATDGSKIYYDPEWIKQQTNSRLIYNMAHECGHVAFNQITRRGERDPHNWNWAADQALNTLLNDSGLTIPKDSVQPDPQYRNMTAEQIYELLPKNSDGGGSCCGCGMPSRPTNEQGQPMSSSEVKEVESRNNQLLSQALMQAKARGNMPESLRRMVEAVLHPPQSYVEILRQFVNESTRDDYDWGRVNRKYLGRGFALPDLHDETVGDIVLVFDTSGSTSNEREMFLGHIRKIADELTPSTLTVIYCDSKVQHVEEFTPDDYPITQTEVHGGGGTDLRAPFEYIEEQGMEPNCLVYLTDLMGPMPKDEPGYPVLWVTDQDRGTQGSVGRTVFMEH